MRDVELRRGARLVLTGVSLEVRRGELVALMGPSGVGKTSILRAIAGLEGFQSGTVEVEDLQLNAGERPSATVRLGR
jgi:ABC-type sugar transport system ATPase subunit